VAATLAVWGNPYGAVILEEARRQHPDLFALEHQLDHAYARRVRRIARRGGTPMIEHVRLAVDVSNTWSALLLAANEASVPAEQLWISGGAVLPRAIYLEAAGVSGAERAAARLAAVWVGTPLADALREPDRAAAMEEAALDIAIRKQRRFARLEPTGSAPVILYVLRLRAELRNLRRIVWGVALRAPADTLAEDLVGV
jgi:vacuolar-type H+-ATPase subunit C/Vma6